MMSRVDNISFVIIPVKKFNLSGGQVKNWIY